MIDLKPFCDVFDVRSYINAPFSEGEFTYATNGEILIRVARRKDVPDIEANHMKNKILEIFASAPFIKSVDIPAVPPMIEEDCDCCNGDGTHDYQCGNAPAYPCGECDGTGARFVEPGDTIFPFVEIGDAQFQPKYVRLIKALPNIQISPNGLKAAPFRFDGGDGILMPMRK